MRFVAAVVVVSLASSAALATDVFNMGGTRDPVTGQWTGNASIEFVTVGDVGNEADTRTGNGRAGQVYQIDKYDVTAAQYCVMLNAVAKTDQYGLYNASMAPANNVSGTFGITRTGNPGSYTYTVTGNGNFPVNFVTWGNAARFCNWLSNGQPTGAEGSGTTETGSYTLNGATTASALMAVSRNPGAKYAIPKDSEWYKAAYYKGGGRNAGYWWFPTQSDTKPNNSMSYTGANNANYDDITYINGSPVADSYTDPTNFLTAVGSFASSPSAYGTYDQGGDVWQWTEQVIGTNRSVRGGGYDSSLGALESPDNFLYDPTTTHIDVGFRVVSLTPEPATLSLLALGGLLLARRRRA